MEIILASDNHRIEWDQFVILSNESSAFHLYGWRRIFEANYGFKTFYLMAMDRGIVKGVLPLILLKSRLTGTFFMSLPVSDDGGFCGGDKEAYDLLLQKAIEIGRSEGADYIEFHHKRRHAGLATRESKVSMWLRLDPDPQKMWANFNNKVRNQVRKASKSGLEIKIGGMEEIDRFYEAYAINMRDLGIPGHGRKFFEHILAEFPDKARIFSVVARDKTAAAGFTFGFKNKLEIPWASSIRKYNSFCPNHLLYWEIVKYACNKGYDYFSFGRSLKDSGTFRFKRQWGTEPRQLYWQYCVLNGNGLPETNAQSPRYSLAIKLWQRTPLFMTKLMGPRLMRVLPY